MKTNVIPQARKEIEEEKKRERVEEAKNVLRQIEKLKEHLAELEQQIKDM